MYIESIDMARLDAATADEALARMGYQSELPRNLSMLSILGLYVLHIDTGEKGKRTKK